MKLGPTIARDAGHVATRFKNPFWNLTGDRDSDAPACGERLVTGQWCCRLAAGDQIMDASRSDLEKLG
jgi:hypothetical protein